MLEVIQRESASFLTEEEISEMVSVENIMDNKVGKAANIVVGKNGYEIQVLNGHEDHSAIVGGTSSGKTRYALMPYLLTTANANHSFIVNDCKVEILPYILPFVKEKNYKVVILDFKNPDKSVDKYNPLAICFDEFKKGNEARAMRMVKNLAYNLFDSVKSSKDRYWENVGMATFVGACRVLFRHVRKEEEVSLSSVMLLINELVQDMNLYLERIEGPFGKLRPSKKIKVSEAYFKEDMKKSIEYQSLQSILDNAKETTQCVLSIIRTALDPFVAFDDIVSMTSGANTFDMKEIGERPTAVFVLTSDCQKHADPLVSIFFDQVYNELVIAADAKTSRKLKIKTHFIIDEFSSLPAINDFEKKISLARSRGITFLIVVQSLSSLRHIYGAEVTDNILANAANLIYFNSGEVEFQRLIRDRLGFVRLPSGVEEYLVSLNTLNDLKVGQCLCIHRGKAFFAELPDISEYEVPYTPLKYYKNNRRRKNQKIEVFSLKEMLYERFAAETGLSVHTVKTGEGFPREEEEVEIDAEIECDEVELMNLLPRPSAEDLDRMMAEIDMRIAELEAQDEEERRQLEKEQKKQEKKALKHFEKTIKKKTSKKEKKNKSLKKGKDDKSAINKKAKKYKCKKGKASNKKQNEQQAE